MTEREPSERERLIARYLCREFMCAAWRCAECTPGSRAFEHAEAIMRLADGEQEPKR